MLHKYVAVIHNFRPAYTPFNGESWMSLAPVYVEMIEWMSQNGSANYECCFTPDHGRMSWGGNIYNCAILFRKEADMLAFTLRFGQYVKSTADVSTRLRDGLRAAS